jgi:hypothetical protein
MRILGCKTSGLFDYINQLSRDQNLAERIANLGRATRRSNMARLGAASGSGRLGRLGRIGMGLGLLLAPLTAQATAESIGCHLRNFADDKMRGKDDWALVDALSLRHELNQRGLF